VQQVLCEHVTYAGTLGDCLSLEPEVTAACFATSHSHEPLVTYHVASCAARAAMHSLAVTPSSHSHLEECKACVSGWAGNGDISDMLAQSLHIGGLGQPSAASSRGPFGKSAVESSNGSLTSSAKHSRCLATDLVCYAHTYVYSRLEQFDQFLQ